MLERRRDGGTDRRVGREVSGTEQRKSETEALEGGGGYRERQRGLHEGAEDRYSVQEPDRHRKEEVQIGEGEDRRRRHQQVAVLRPIGQINRSKRQDPRRRRLRRCRRNQRCRKQYFTAAESAVRDSGRRSRRRESVSPSSKAGAAATTAAGSVEEPEDSVPAPRSTVGIRFRRAWRVVASLERQFSAGEFRAEEAAFDEFQRSERKRRKTEGEGLGKRGEGTDSGDSEIWRGV